MEIHNQNFFDFFGVNGNIKRTLAGVSNKLISPLFISEGNVPSPGVLPDPTMSLGGPIITHKYKRLGSLDVGDVALIIAGIVVLSLIGYFFYNRWKDKKEEERKGY